MAEEQCYRNHIHQAHTWSGINPGNGLEAYHCPGIKDTY